jgi:hypothetical protein
MWESQRLTTLWASKACYRYSFTFFNLSIYLSIYVSIYLLFSLAARGIHKTPLFTSFSYLRQLVELLGWGTSPTHGRYLHTKQHKHRENANIHGLSGIRTYDPSVPAGEDISCLRQRGHYNRPNNNYLLTYGAKPLLKSCQLCSHSRTSQHFKEPEGSSPCSQEPSTGPYPEPDRSSPYHPILSL